MIGNKDAYGIKNAQYNAHEKTTNPSVWPCSEFSIIVNVITTVYYFHSWSQKLSG